MLPPISSSFLVDLTREKGIPSLHSHFIFAITFGKIHTTSHCRNIKGVISVPENQSKPFHRALSSKPTHYSLLHWLPAVSGAGDVLRGQILPTGGARGRRKAATLENKKPVCSFQQSQLSCRDTISSQQAAPTQGLSTPFKFLVTSSLQR